MGLTTLGTAINVGIGYSIVTIGVATLPALIIGVAFNVGVGYGISKIKQERYGDQLSTNDLEDIR